MYSGHIGSVPLLLQHTFGFQQQYSCIWIISVSVMRKSREEIKNTKEETANLRCTIQDDLDILENLLWQMSQWWAPTAHCPCGSPAEWPSLCCRLAWFSCCAGSNILASIALRLASPCWSKSSRRRSFFAKAAENRIKEWEAQSRDRQKDGRAKGMAPTHKHPARHAYCTQERDVLVHKHTHNVGSQQTLTGNLQYIFSGS